MMITKHDIAQKISAYMNQAFTKEELINWCEAQMQEADFESPSVRDVIARLGVMDSKNFELSYEDLSSFLTALGYHLHVEVTA